MTTSNREDEWHQSYVLRRIAELERENERLQSTINDIMRRQKEQDRERK